MRKTISFWVLPLVAVWSASADPIPQFTQANIDNAVGYATLRFDDTAILSSQNYAYGSASVVANYLAFVAFFNPTATATNGTKVADRVVQNIHSALTTSPGLLMRGIQYAWYEPYFASTLALAKYTPAVWNQLTADDKNRADWIMKVGALVGNMQHNSANANFMDTEFVQNGGYLPNQRNGMVAWMSYAYMYFGSAAAVNQILASFDWNTYIAQFNAFGWTNLVHTFTVNPLTRTMFESGGTAAYATVQSQGVRLPFTFRGRIISNHACCDTYQDGESVLPYDPFELFYREEYEYDSASNVVNKSCATSVCGYGYVISGSMPELGQIGMFAEYNVYADRSSPEYSAWAAKAGTFHLATLCALGFWNKGETRHDAAMDRFNRAMRSMIYSDSVGWYDNTPAYCKIMTAITDFKGGPFWREIWNVMLSSYPAWTYHPLSGAAPTSPTPPAPPTNLSATVN
jgi:hypothetical protein